MKTLFQSLMFSLFMLTSYNASADFFDGDDCPPWEYDCNDWPEWTPMYWMEEFSDEFDDDDDYYRYGGAPWGRPMPYGPPPMPYGGPMGGPMGGPAPYGAPYGAPAPRPYGAPAPYGRPPMMRPAPYGAPRPPYGAPPAPVAPPSAN